MLFLREKLVQDGRKGFWGWSALTISLWYLFTTYWVSFATPIASPAIIITGLGMTLPAWWLFHYVSKRSTRTLAYTVLISGWVVIEWWNGLGDISFPWILLGSAWADNTMVVQWYSIFGQSGGTLWVMLCNVLAFEVIRTKFSRSRVAWFSAMVLVPVALSLVLYNLHKESTQRVEVAIIQPNVDAYKKFSNGTAWDQTRSILELAQSAPTGTKLFVAPETALVSSVNLPMIESNRDVAAIQDFLRDVSPEGLFIIGASTRDKAAHYNSVLYISKDSVKVYHKRKLVLAVETVPEWVSPFANALDMGGYVGSLGRSSEAMVVGGVGAVVCYESIYSEHFAEWVSQGAQLMAIITNDGWWRDTHGYRQHFDFARLRAVESGRWIVRSANTGISGIIDSRGDVIESLGWDKRGVVCGSVELRSEVTFYTLWGDIVTRLSVYVLCLSLLYFVSMRYRKQ